MTTKTNAKPGAAIKPGMYYLPELPYGFKDLEPHISEEQLRIYAIGYRSLCGQKPDFIEIYNIDENKTDHRKQIVDSDLEETRKLIYASADNIKKNILSKKCSLENCTTCYKSHLCLSTEKRKELGVK